MNNVDYDPNIADRDEYGHVTIKSICPLECDEDELPLVDCENCPRCPCE
jgi:hypothetical protein